MNIPERKLKILAAIIDEHIATGEPVGSKNLIKALDFAVSSATIRNEMAELAEQGLLIQPHTSAGRVPSQRAYRLYIDRLMHRKTLDHKQKRMIDQMLSGISPNRLGEDLGSILSQLTNCMALSACGGGQDLIRRIEVILTSPRSMIMVILTSSGTLKNRLCHSDYDLDPATIAKFTSFANSRLSNISCGEISLPLMQTLAASFPENTLEMLPLFTGLYDTAVDSARCSVYAEGESYLLGYEEIPQLVLKQMLEFLSRKDRIAGLLNLLETSETGVYIGDEIPWPQFHNASLIFANYHHRGLPAGKVAIIGPTRLDYAEKIAWIEYFSKAVEMLLNEAYIQE